MGDLQSHLTWYKGMPWSCIPLQRREKRPGLQIWRTYTSRFPSEWEYKGWFPEDTQSNIGIITGKISKLVVVDIDNEEGYLTMNTLPKTMTAKTSHGYHLYYQCFDPGRTVTFEFCGKTNHVKSEGSYVVAPPSIHPDGTKYEFISHLPAAIQEYDEILKAITAAGGVFPSATLPDRPITWASELCMTQGEGNRNTAAAQLCGLLINKFKYDPELIMGLMVAWNSYYCSPSLGDHELRNLVDQEYRRYGPQER